MLALPLDAMLALADFDALLALAARTARLAAVLDPCPETGQAVAAVEAVARRRANGGAGFLGGPYVAHDIDALREIVETAQVGATPRR